TMRLLISLSRNINSSKYGYIGGNDPHLFVIVKRTAFFVSIPSPRTIRIQIRLLTFLR
ncbi:hypothetical protein L9F63_028025, partial [Diploptera punctata]